MPHMSWCTYCQARMLLLIKKKRWPSRPSSRNLCLFLLTPVPNQLSSPSNPHPRRPLLPDLLVAQRARPASRVEPTELQYDSLIRAHGRNAITVTTRWRTNLQVRSD